MIRTVTFAHTDYADPPSRFEAGTPNIIGAVGLAAAIDYVEGLGLPAIGEHEQDLLARGTDLLREIPGLRLIGQARERANILSFALAGIHPHDAATILDRQGIAVRAGFHHCAQPAMERFGVPGTLIASLGLWQYGERAGGAGGKGAGGRAAAGLNFLARALKRGEGGCRRAAQAAGEGIG
jgi:cysteine desulfurase/selenocysteine lyase